MKTITLGRGVVDVGRSLLPRLTRLPVIAVLVCGGLSWPAAAMARMVVDATTAIVIDGAEPGPLQKASRICRPTSDVSSAGARLSSKPRDRRRERVICMYLSGPNPRASTALGLGTTCAYRSLPGAELHRPRTIVLTGSDVRGAMYAIISSRSSFWASILSTGGRTTRRRARSR